MSRKYADQIVRSSDGNGLRLHRPHPTGPCAATKPVAPVAVTAMTKAGWIYLGCSEMTRQGSLRASKAFSELVVGIALNVHPALGLKPLDELSQPGVTLALQIVVVSARKPDVTTREEARLGTTKKAEQICA